MHDTLVSIEEITGGSGDDYFVGNAYDNIFSGGRGHDYFVASAGNDAYRGGAGYDMLDFSAIKAGLRFEINPANGVTSVRYAGGGQLAVKAHARILRHRCDLVARCLLRRLQDHIPAPLLALQHIPLLGVLLHRPVAGWAQVLALTQRAVGILWRGIVITAATRPHHSSSRRCAHTGWAAVSAT